MVARFKRPDRGDEIWPGFVDALSALLMVVIFLLVVFMLAQFFLGVTLSGRNKALDELNLQVSELAALLSLERRANTDLRLDIAELSSQLQSSTAARDALDLQLEAAVDQAKRTAEETGELRAALRKVRGELKAEVARLARLRDKNATALNAERDRGIALESRLRTEEERSALARREIEDREQRLNELRLALRQSDGELTTEQALSVRAANRITLLSEQIAALRRQLAQLSEALEIAERTAKSQGVVISNLGRKLNLALAGKVEELQRYRSEFFGRLREALGNHAGIRIVDDRFVFQSEVLFGSGSATLETAGRDQMVALARTLLAIARDIPDDLPWILRVDGHTDNIPIHTDQFSSNWELSSARALSVVHYLINQGVPPDRLVAAGFGEFQPIDPRGDEIAFRRNRRIELKLTSR